jgi:AhpD family alkylhydroperoxidase
MRLAPIEEPSGLLMRIAFWTTRRQFGKVLTPMKVLYTRVPGIMKAGYEIQKFESSGMSLDAGLHTLLGVLVSKINGCSFCIDITRAAAIRRHVGTDKFNALSEYRTSGRFSARERAALAYVEEATRHKKVSDDTFAALRAQFTEAEIVEITWLNAVQNFYNLINIPLEIGSDGLCALAERQHYARNSAGGI